MIVVLPVCAKDIDAALRNLAWINSLNSQTGYDCIVAHESTFNADAVYELACKVFSNVTRFIYPPSPIEGWPMAPNWAWKHCAAHIRTAVNQPWLWWEQDAIPLKPCWLDALDLAYKSARKPYLGTTHETPIGLHLTGVAIYPPDAAIRNPDMALSVRTPFDIAGGKNVLSQACVTPLIQHVWSIVGNQYDSPPPTFDSSDSLSLISSEAVLFHRCKDASLITALQSPRPRKKSFFNGLISILKGPPSVTVVITNFRRPQFLWEAFESVRAANIDKIVVTSSGVTDEVETVHHRITQACPKAVLISERGDSGSNTNWLRGVEAARSNWVQILHDDDRLLPAYSKITDHLGSADFVCWDAKTHGEKAGLCRVFAGLSYGIHSTQDLIPFLMCHRLSPSPVAGCFQRSHLLETLSACSSLGPEYHIGNLMIGNDFLIWIKAIQRYKTLNYLSTPLSSFGHHSGSATVQGTSGSDNRLINIYDRIRLLAQSGNFPNQSDVARLALPSVTLLGIDTWRPLRTLRAMRRCSSIVDFGDTAIVTTPDAAPTLRGPKILPLIKSPERLERERFIVTRLREAFTTSHAMHMEWDAAISNPSTWRDEWLSYDYIGAPWRYPHVFHGQYEVTPRSCVGNFGFSLFSRNFADALSSFPSPTDAQASVSDVYISIGLRPKLESMGIKFAPEQVAERFSCECRPYTNQFGWHGQLTARMNNFDL